LQGTVADGDESKTEEFDQESGDDEGETLAQTCEQEESCES
jgi:hypothetical protein